MKKIYLLTMTVCMGATAFAQSLGLPAKQSTNTTAKVYQHTPQVKAAALGDTLFLFDANSFYITNTDDQNDFAYENVDVDGLTPYNSSLGVESDWNFYYSLEPSDLTPNWDTDTAYFISATSWFDPAGQADNWFTFGPITIPAGGAKMTFLNRNNPAYTDGISVFVSLTGTTPYVDFEPTTDSPIFSKADCLPPGCTQPGQDTIWTEFSGSLSNWAGERVYVGFWHNTNDGDVSYLDHFVITETDDVGIEDISDAGNTLYQNRPNPVLGTTSINYELAKFNEKIELEVYDVMGRKVKDVNLGEQSAGKHVYSLDAAELASGTYYYTLVTDASRLTRKMVITK